MTDAAAKISGIDDLKPVPERRATRVVVEWRDVAQPCQGVNGRTQVVAEKPADGYQGDDGVDETPASGHRADSYREGPEHRAQQGQMEAPREQVRRADLGQLGDARDRDQGDGEDPGHHQHANDQRGEALDDDGGSADRMRERQVEPAALLIARDRRAAQRGRHDDDQGGAQQSEGRRP